MAETSVASTPDEQEFQDAAAVSPVRMARRELFRTLFDPTSGRGLEIGPLHRAISDKATDDVRYVDVFDQAGLRRSYHGDPNVPPDQIPVIDFWLIDQERTLTLAEAAAPAGPYDWVVASHVIEHVPDLVGWLQQLSALTHEGSRLVLAVPDRRYCFDRHRPPTTVGEVLAAHEAQAQIPGIRAVYDHLSTAVTVNPERLWAGRRPPGRSALIHGTAWAYEQLERTRRGDYVDAHVWTFTPQGLVEQVAELRSLGLVDWYVERIEEQPGTVEFLAVLHRVPADGDFEEVPLESDLPDWLAQEWATRKQLAVAQRRNAELRARVERLERRLASMQQSTSWRLGQSVVRPVAALRRRLRSS